MKKQLIILSVVTLSLGLGVTSCKKEGCTDPTATNYNEEAKKDDGSCTYATNPGGSAANPGGYTPSYSGTFATLVGIKTITTTQTVIGPVDSELGTAVAVFSDNGGASFQSAGNVSCNSNALTQNSNNSYVFTPSQANPTGISFGSTVSWEGTGSTWPAFTGTTAAGFSTVEPISSGNVSTSSNYTLSCSSVTNADSVYFAVYGPDGNVMKVLGPNTNSYTFTAAELSALGAGNGFVQIIGINYDPQNIGSRDYWFLNETVRTSSVTIN